MDNDTRDQLMKLADDRGVQLLIEDTLAELRGVPCIVITDGTIAESD